jgi:hypothetical protein
MMTMSRYDNKPHRQYRERKNALSPAQFESLISQIPSMTHSQLQSLQREIVESRHPVTTKLLTEDEMDLISSLF